MKEFLATLTWPTFWQAAARLTTGAVSLILTWILTRNLGVENFGNFTKILVLATIFYLPADFGLNAAFIKLTKPGLIKKLFFNLFLLRLFLSVVLILISFAIGTSLYSNQTAALLLVSFTILTTATTLTATAYFQLKLKFFWPFLTNFFGALFSLFLIWSFIPNLQLPIIFGAILLGQTLSAFLNLGKVLQELKFIFEKIDFLLIRKYFLTSAAVGLTLIFNLIYFKADLILLSVLKPPTSVGFYGLAVKIFEWAILPPVFLLNSAFPILAKAYTADLVKFKRLCQITSLVLLILGITVFLPLFFFSDFLVEFVGGEEFAQAGKALKILASGVPVFYLTGLLMWLLVILAKKRELVAIYGGGLVLNVITNLIFIPKFDFLASAAITVAAESLILVASFILLLRPANRLK